ncbi:MAG: TonB-dependent receptor [Hyphomonadaceae bacterium]|nr:TonB-dependent receptor [Hyphomonadaceae bacterium]
MSNTNQSKGARTPLLRTASAAVIAATAALGAAPAFAQSEDDAIVVTGSRIARSDANSALPLTVVDAEAIANAGIVGLGEILRRDPAVSGGGVGQSNILSGGGAQTVDLRNLGPARTLVLINGQRYSLFTDTLQNGGQDLGLLPASMIQRVEILRDGASTAYGADAVAGVVNFILRDNYDGLDISGLYGISERGDGEQMRIGMMAGASNDRGNVTIAMEYINRDAIEQSSRDWGANPLGAGANANPFASIGSSIGGPQLRRLNGTLVEAFGNYGGSLGAASTARYNYALNQDVVQAMEGYNIALSANYEITDHIDWHGAAIYGSRYSEFSLAANPIQANSPTGPFLAGLVIRPSAANPYGENLSLTWRPVAYGERHNSVQAGQIWISTGLSGEIATNYRWDVTATHSEVNTNSQTSVLPNVSRLSRILNPDDCYADPVCSSPSIGPVANIRDLFSNATPFTAAQYNYVFYIQSTNSRFITDTVQASISGPIMTLPAGDVAFAAGVEYREEYGNATPDSVTTSGESVANATFHTEGTFDVLEFFGEIDIPLLRGAPLAQELSLNLQGRRSDFSNFGSAETWKVGFVWAPWSDLRVRANMGASFRAPNVTELYSIGVQSFNGLTDPCTTGSPGSGVSTGAYLDTAAAANCAAVGVPLDYVQPAAQLRVLAGGNPNLQPEEGETYTFGFVYQPSFFTPLTLTADYWHIELDAAVVAQGLQARLNNCYRTQPASALAPGGACETLGARTAAGVPTNLSSIRVNAATTSMTAGIDFTLMLDFANVGPGDLRIASRNSFLLEADGGIFLGAGFDAPGYLDGNINGGSGYPEWRSVLDIDYAVGPWTLSWQSRFQSSLYDPNCATPRTTAGAFCSNPNALGYNGTPDYALHDARIRFAGDTYSLTFGVNNIADEQPPYAIVTGTNTYPALFDVIGRSYFVGLNARF